MKTPDANAIAREHGDAELRRRSEKAYERGRINGSASASSGTMRFKLVPFRDLKPNDNRRDLVKDFIPRTGLTVVWGPPKSLKSFFVTDTAMHVVLGWDYCGRRVTQGPVVYCAFEGAKGHEARAEAFRRHRLTEDDTDVPFFLIGTPMDLIADVPELIACIRQALNGESPVAVVFDTLNRSLRGSESKDEDMGAYVQAAGHVIDAFQCAVIVVHHCGIDDKRPRGHTSLTGAAEAQIAIKRDGSTVTATVEWMKDGAEGATVSHQLKVVEVGTDQDGAAITSCVLEPVELPTATPRPERKLSDRQKLGIAALTRVVAARGEPLPAVFGLPASIMAVNIDDWREELTRSGAIPRDHKNPREEFRRQKDALQARKLIAIRDDRVWLA